MTFDCGLELREMMRLENERQQAYLNAPPSTPDEVRAAEIGFLQLFRSCERRDGESLDSMLKRRWPYARDPKYFSKANFPFRVQKSATIKLLRWCKKHCKGKYSSENDGFMSFELSNDALLFKLSLF